MLGSLFRPGYDCDVCVYMIVAFLCLFMYLLVLKAYSVLNRVISPLILPPAGQQVLQGSPLSQAVDFVYFEGVALKGGLTGGDWIF